MCIKSKLTFLFFGLIVFSCKPKESPDFYYTSKGLRYKFHAKNDLAMDLYILTLALPEFLMKN